MQAGRLSIDLIQQILTHSYRSFLPWCRGFFFAFHFDSGFVLPLRRYTFFSPFFCTTRCNYTYNTLLWLSKCNFISKKHLETGATA